MKKLTLFGAVSFAFCLIDCGCLPPRGEESFVADAGKVSSVPVSSIRYTQETMNPNFSDGSNVKAVIDELKKGRKTPGDFPPIKVLKATEYGEDVYFSLDNRRLYAFKNSTFANATIQVVGASVDEAIEQVWKLTSQSDGYTITLTSSPDKDLRPPLHTTLGKVREHIEKAAAGRARAGGGHCSVALSLNEGEDKPSLALQGNCSAKKPGQDIDHDVNMRKQVTSAAWDYKAAATAGDAVRAARAGQQAVQAFRTVTISAGKLIPVAGQVAGAAGLALGIADAVQIKKDGGSDADAAAAVLAGTPGGAIASAVACAEKGCSETEKAMAFFAGLFGIPFINAPANVDLVDGQYKLLGSCGPAEDSATYRSWVKGRICWKPFGQPEQCREEECRFCYLRGSDDESLEDQMKAKYGLQSYYLAGNPNCSSL